MRNTQIRGYFPPLLVSYHKNIIAFSSVQFSSITQLCPTLCDPMNCSRPGLSVHHQLPISQNKLHFFKSQKHYICLLNFLKFCILTIGKLFTH